MNFAEFQQHLKEVSISELETGDYFIKKTEVYDYSLYQLQRPVKGLPFRPSYENLRNIIRYSVSYSPDDSKYIDGEEKVLAPVSKDILYEYLKDKMRFVSCPLYREYEPSKVQKFISFFKECFWEG